MINWIEMNTVIKTTLEDDKQYLISFTIYDSDGEYSYVELCTYNKTKDIFISEDYNLTIDADSIDAFVEAIPFKK